MSFSPFDPRHTHQVRKDSMKEETVSHGLSKEVRLIVMKIFLNL